MKFLILSFFIFTQSYAADVVSHKPHSHGAALLGVTVAESTISATLDISGYDLMGFEGTPKTQVNKNSLKSTTDLFSKSYSMFISDEDAHCKVTKRELKSEENIDPGHTDYVYKIEYQCKDMTKLTELNVNLFNDLKSLTQLTVQLVTEKTQKEIKLNPKNTIIGL